MSNSELEQKIAEMQQQIQQLQQRLPAEKNKNKDEILSMLVFSGDYDKLLTAFIIATGAASMGMKVSMYFTFWGMNALKKKTGYSNKASLEKMMAIMNPSNAEQAPLSNMNMLGLGKVFIKKIMEKNNVASLSELIALAQELNIEMTACQMTMGLMGISKNELLDNVSFGGVAAYTKILSESSASLLI